MDCATPIAVITADDLTAFEEPSPSSTPIRCLAEGTEHMGLDGTYLFIAPEMGRRYEGFCLLAEVMQDGTPHISETVLLIVADLQHPLQAIAWTTFAYTGGEYLDDPEWFPLLKRAAAVAIAKLT